MRGSGRFEPEALTADLPEFPAAAGAPDARPPASLAAYADFYRLDFHRRRTGASHAMGWLPSGEHRIVVQRFDPAEPRGTAVVCHGYYDHVGLYGHLIEYLLELDLTVLCFDLPGHGLSSGDRASIGSFDEYVDALRDVLSAAAPALPKPWHILGQSMGGAVTMEYLVRHGADDFAEVVLFAPLIRPANWGWSRFVYAIARRTIESRPRTLTDNAENPEFMALMKVDPLAPQVLPVRWVTAMVDWFTRFEAYPSLPFTPRVIQGHADRTVGWKHNLRVLRDKTRPAVLEIPEARHHLVNESDAIRAHMFEWLRPHLSPPRDGS